MMKLTTEIARNLEPPSGIYPCASHVRRMTAKSGEKPCSIRICVPHKGNCDLFICVWPSLKIPTFSPFLWWCPLWLVGSGRPVMGHLRRICVARA
jgi:hypothetical protein